MDHYLTFEHPLNEKVRAFLRVEHLIEQAKHDFAKADSWSIRGGIQAYLDIIQLSERIDLRQEAIKELDRLKQTLTLWQSSHSADEGYIQQLLSDVDFHQTSLMEMPSKLGQSLTHHSFLNHIKRRITIPGGTCSFDLPMYHYWLNKPAEERQQDVDDWLESVSPLTDAIAFVLQIMRQSGNATQATAQHGHFQQQFAKLETCQLVQVHVPQSLPYYPEISGSKHCINLRFFNEPEQLSQPASVASEDVDFYISCCGM